MRRTIAAAALAILVGASGSVSAETDAIFGDLAGTTLAYDLSVDGSPVGTAEGAIRRTKDGLWTVEMRTLIDVEVIGALSVYTLDMRVSETYDADRLVAFDCTATENETLYETAGELKDGRFIFTRNGEQDSAPPDIVPSTQLWRQVMMARTTVLHALEGRILEREIEPLGNRRLESADGPMLATGFRVYTDDDDARLWFDETGLLVEGHIEQPLVSLKIERRTAELPTSRDQ